ncbi:MAG: SMP-30/gluconolactonase/LRE family protein [Gemmataceae bacterium]
MTRLSTLAFVLALPAFAQDVPKGTTFKFTFDTSKVFPGTTRDVTVYVPKQYDGSKPACVHVNQDGMQFKANDVFDKLIAEGKMPVTIGVFAGHGIVKALSPAAQDRFDRSHEYDGLGGDFARFLLDELLPAVEAKTTPDGRPIKLSKDGNDRSIAGTSSGAIAAFTAAWERPDAFRRVFSGVGTYVGLRGGHVYPTLIRKVEPKPIRVFLQDGSKDNNAYGGDWWMANQAMERSLTYMGYEVKHEWGEGGHNNDHATQLFPEAMAWLWKDYPAPVKTPAGSKDFQSVFGVGEAWQLVGEGYRSTEGTCVNAKGEVFFNDVPANKTYKVGLDGSVTLFADNGKRGDGQGFGPDGRLYQVAAGTNEILAYGPDGKPTVFADGFKGNDLVVNHAGGVYVTNPYNEAANPCKIWYVSPKGEKKVVDSGALKFANGVTLSPDQSVLYVADSRTHWVWCYQVQPDGSLKHKTRFAHLHVHDSADETGADGMRCDRDGRLYVATRMGIQVCDPLGRVHAIVPTPNGRVSNLCFGGEAFDTLYAACGDKVYKRKVMVKGAQAFLEPNKPSRPGL